MNSKFKNKDEIKDFLKKEIEWKELKLMQKFIFSKFYSFLMFLGIVFGLILWFILRAIRMSSWNKVYKKVEVNNNFDKCLSFFFNNEINIKSINVDEKKYKYDNFFYDYNNFFKKNINDEPKWSTRYKFYTRNVSIANIDKIYKINNGILFSAIETYTKPYFGFEYGGEINRYIFTYEKKVNKKYENLNLYIRRDSFFLEDASALFFIKKIFRILFKRKNELIKNIKIEAKAKDYKLAKEFLTYERKEKLINFIKNQKRDWKRNLKIIFTDQRMIVFNEGTMYLNLFSTHASNKKVFINSIYLKMKKLTKQINTTIDFFELNNDILK